MKLSIVVLTVAGFFGLPSLGCYSPSFSDCELVCAGMTCPSGLQCSTDGYCRPPNAPGTCPPPGLDASGDTMPNDSDLPAGPWGAPTVVFPATDDDDPSLTPDLLEMWFNQSQQIFVTKRSTFGAAWSSRVQDPALTLPGSNSNGPELSHDGLAIYFASDRPGSLGTLDLWMSRRASLTAMWSPPVHLPELSSQARDSAPSLSADGLTIVFDSERILAGDPDLFMATRPTTSSAWSTPQPITELNFPGQQQSPHLGSDNLTIFFEANMTMPPPNDDLYVARRPTPADPFGTPTRIVELNTPAVDQDPWLTADGRHMFFTTVVGGVFTIVEASR